MVGPTLFLFDKRVESAIYIARLFIAPQSIDHGPHSERITNLKYALLISSFVLLIQASRITLSQLEDQEGVI